MSVLERVLAQAARTPDAVAVRQWDGTLTYAELAGTAGAVADGLRAAGVGPGSVVGVCVERVPALPAALLGVWLAGAAYLPLDPALPAGRLAQLVADAGVRVVVADAPGRSRVDGPRVVDLPTAAGLSAPGTDLPNPGAGPWASGAGPSASGAGLAASGAGLPGGPGTGPGAPAYVMYTSGSTGRPKGVVVPHGALAHCLAVMAERLGTGPGTVALGFASIGFDVSVLDLFLPLSTGGTVALAGAADRGDPARLQRFLAEHRVTTADVPPTLLPLLEPAALPALTVVLTGSEAPGPEQVARWTAHGARMFNLYGPTEATINVTWHEVAGSWDAPLPIGVPLPGHRAHVVDPDLREVPDGEPGELLIGGPGLALGYLGDPALTARRFVPDPFLPGERLYRTGDQVVRQADGLLHFLGRLDRQVKIRGQRVETGEVEAVLRRHPAVGHAAVDAVPGPAGLELVAYVTPADVPAAALREHCAGRLPAVMVPARVVGLDALPLLPSAKVDLNRLRSLLAPGPGAARRRAPETAIERAVAAAWSTVLGTTEVGLDDDFLACGGHSVAAMYLVAALRGDLDRDVEVEDVLLGRTLAGIAARVDRAAPLGGADLVGGNPPALGAAQRRLWFSDRYAPHSTAYNIAAAERLRGPLDVPALAVALGAVQTRQDVLRWRIAERDGVPHAVADPPGDVPLPVVEVTEDELPAALDALARTRFDLAVDRLWTVVLHRLGPDDHVLGIVAHHAVFDGWSQHLLYADLGSAYARARRGLPAGLEPLPAGYADYVAWREQRLHRRGDADLAWWVEHLAGAPTVLELPADRPRPAAPGLAGHDVAADVDADTARQVTALARELAVTTPAVLLAALALLVRRLTGVTDMVLGTPAADRRHAAFAETVGFFVEIMPLRLRVDDAATVADHVLAVRDELIAAFAHPEAALERIVGALGIGGDGSRNPVAQVLFNMFSFAAPDLALDGLAVQPVPVRPPGSPFDLTLYAQERDGRLEVSMLAAADLFDESRVTSFLDAYLHVVRALVAAPEGKVGEVRLPAGLAERTEPLPPAPAAAAVPAARSAGGPAPATPTEQLVAAVWAEVLDRPAVDATESFFDVGGTSLAVAAVQARLQRRLDRPVSLVELFRFPTVRALAAHLDGGPAEQALARAAQRGAARRSTRRGRR